MNCLVSNLSSMVTLIRALNQPVRDHYLKEHGVELYPVVT
jgi:hypothetical protein